MRVVIWTDEQATKELRMRLEYAKAARKDREHAWRQSEKTVFGKSISSTSGTDLAAAYEEIDGSSIDLQVAYAFKNFRFIHAQMSANPPAVVIKPTSNDQEDRRKSGAADKLVQHGLRVYNLTERVDSMTLNTILYGTGYIKNTWNPHIGDILEVDRESGEMVLEGDIDIKTPSVWNIYLDPDSECEDDLRYVFEKRVVPWEDAMFFWPDQVEKLERYRMRYPSSEEDSYGSETSALVGAKYDAVEVYEYWEKGLPHNGYLGKFCMHLEDGTLLTKVKPSPFRFTVPGARESIEKRDIPEDIKQKKLERLPEIARLPYHILTDIDVPNNILGKSFLEYVTPLQNILNSLDTMKLENVQAHGTARLVLPEGTEIADESITDSPWDVIKITGVQPPHHISPPQLMPDMSEMRGVVKLGIDDLSGVNEALLGQQSRETSGASLQFSANQGNMIRRRLFNKYRGAVEGLYRDYLDLIRRHWEVERTVKVVGKEKAMEAAEIKGADIDGGFDLIVEYGTSLSLDPSTRKEEILSLVPLFEKAGMSPRQLLKYLKLNELDNMYNDFDYAESRQREIFESMIHHGKYIDPRKHADHENMLVYAKRWVMTVEYKVLPEETKQLIDRHIDERAAIAAQAAAGANPAAGGPLSPGPAGAPGALPPGSATGGAPVDQASAPPILG